jgi:hypothetical protein
VLVQRVVAELPSVSAAIVFHVWDNRSPASKPDRAGYVRNAQHGDPALLRHALTPKILTGQLASTSCLRISRRICKRA